MKYTAEQLARIERIEKELEALKQEGMQEDATGAKWRPEKGGDYFYIEEDGDVQRSIFEEDTWCDKTFLYGNGFRTKQEAQTEARRREVTQELKELADFVPDWSDRNKRKHFLMYSYIEDGWVVDFWSRRETAGAIFFKTKEEAQNAIDTLGDKLDVLRSPTNENKG